MCYSAPASFSAAIILAVIGVVVIYRKPKRLLPLALIPCFFAIQQFAEGFVWIDPESTLPKSTYLFFAYAFWPMWIPFATFFAEENANFTS